MSDLTRQRNIGRRLEQTQVIERPGAAGQTAFYETGTYTPTYLGGTTPGATTYTTQIGNYVRLGNMIFVMGQVVWSAATGTGEARISLPFPSTQLSTLGNVRSSGVTFAAGAPEILTSGTSYFVLRSPATNAATAVVNVEAAGDLIFSLAYMMG